MPRFSTPSGRVVEMYVREDTNDWNVCQSVIVEDEYGFAGLPSLDGVAVDVGAHIGSATVALLATNPGLRAIAVEPLPENIKLLRENLALNNLTERCTVVEGAVGTDTVGYLYESEDPVFARVHRFIGNMHVPDDVKAKVIKVRRYTLADLIEMAGGEIALCKIDAEGGEKGFFTDADAVLRIHGEIHDGPAVRLSNERTDFTSDNPVVKAAPRKRRTRKPKA